jgi:hypothetical protein
MWVCVGGGNEKEVVVVVSRRVSRAVDRESRGMGSGIWAFGRDERGGGGMEAGSGGTCGGLYVWVRMPVADGSGPHGLMVVCLFGAHIYTNIYTI